jgi:hypothetical protein
LSTLESILGYAMQYVLLKKNIKKFMHPYP